MKPNPAEELRVLRLLQASSCFKGNCLDDSNVVCVAPPCACAQSLFEEISKIVADNKD